MRRTYMNALEELKLRKRVSKRCYILITYKKSGRANDDDVCISSNNVKIRRWYMFISEDVYKSLKSDIST